MAREGQRRVSVVCPGFATDCLETLEEIAIRNRAAVHGEWRRVLRLHPGAECQRCSCRDARRPRLPGTRAAGRPPRRPLPANRKSHGAAPCARVPRASAGRTLAHRSSLAGFSRSASPRRVIRESLEFYESLGFVQAAVGETWSHPYAVVTDGHLFIGLHGRDLPSPSLTFVLPELRLGVGRLKERGVTFEEEQLRRRRLQPGAAARPRRTERHAAGSAHVLAAAARRADRIGLRLFQRARHSGAGHGCRARVLGIGRFRRARRGSAAVPADAAGQRRPRPGAVSHACAAPLRAHVRGQRHGAAAGAPARTRRYRCPTRCRTLWTMPATAC